ncbi:hypothetical protein I5Q45_04230 [Serratia marcescens]|nr:hypothetical protein [Serratia marcescens]
MKGKIKQIGVVLAVLVLSACAVTKEDIQQERGQVMALKAANKADREVIQAQQTVKVAAAALATAQAALAVVKQNQQKAHADFEALYQSAQPTPPAEPGKQ